MSVRPGEATPLHDVSSSGEEPGSLPRVFRMLLLIQAGAAILLGTCALLQEPSRLPTPLNTAGTLGLWGSLALYGVVSALSLLAALVPRFRRLLAAPFHERARGLLGALAVSTGLLASIVLLFHAADGDVWLSAKVTPFRHSGAVPYLVGAAALGTAIFLVLAIGQALLERVLAGRQGALRVARRVALLLFALACGFVLIETGLRIHAVISPRTDGLGVTPGAALWVRRHVTLNRAGFRDEEFVPRAPDELLVAVLGDSLVYGYGIERTEDRATERLETLLAERLASLPGLASRKTARVMNVALPGAGARRQFEWLKTVVLPMSPDIVVLGHFWNDIRDAAPGERVEEEAVEARRARSWASLRRILRIWIQSQSALGAQLIRARLIVQHRRLDPAEPLLQAYGDAAVYGQHLEIIEAMHRLVGERGGRFAVLLLPDFGYTFAESPYDAVGVRMEEELRRRGVLARDLVHLVPPPFAGGRDVWVNRGDSHPNEKGHAYIGDGLHRVVIEAAGRDVPGAPR